MAVCIGIDLVDQFLAECCPLSRIDDTFKNGILNSLAIILTRFGHPTQSAVPGSSNCRYIITYQHEHKITYLQINGG